MTLLLFFCIATFEKNQAEIRAIERELWSEDFEYLVEQIEELHPNPYRVTSREILEAEFNKLVPMTDKLTEDEIAFEVGRIIALISDGHTLLGSQYGITDTFYPTFCQIIDKKLYIVDGVEEYEDIFYSEVLSFNGIATNEIVERLSKYMSAENKYLKESNVEWRIFNPRVLNYLDVVKDDYKLELELRNEDLIYSREVDVMSYWAIGNYYDERMSWVNSFGVRRSYFYEYIPESNIMIVYYRTCYDDETLSFEEFTSKLWDEVEKYKVDKIIVDVSTNTGGYDETFDPLFYKLFYSEYNEPGKLFVVIGNRTYSAGTTTATRMRKWLNAELIGEPTGGSPTMHYLQESCITPNKGIEIYIATGTFYAEKNSKAEAIIPDVHIEKSIDDYINGINPYLEYVENR